MSDTNPSTAAGAHASAGADAALARQAWDAVTHGRITEVATLLAPDAHWRTGNEGPFTSLARDEIIELLASNLSIGGPAQGEIEQTIPIRGRVVIAFRPPLHPTTLQLDDGLAWVVISTSGGLITEIRACPNRAAAMTYAERGAPTG